MGAAKRNPSKSHSTHYMTRQTTRNTGYLFYEGQELFLATGKWNESDNELHVAPLIPQK
jgi:hypothetical protein